MTTPDPEDEAEAQRARTQQAEALLAEIRGRPEEKAAEVAIDAKTAAFAAELDAALDPFGRLWTADLKRFRRGDDGRTRVDAYYECDEQGIPHEVFRPGELRLPEPDR